MSDANDDAPLSGDGDVRRGEILADALRAADRRRYKRLAVRAGAGVGAACVVAAAAIVSLRNQPSTPAPPTIAVEHRQQQARPTTSRGGSGRSIVDVRPASKPASAPATAVTVEILRDDPSKRTWEVLNDEQFLAALADAGRPAGLVRVNGETRVVPQ